MPPQVLLRSTLQERSLARVLFVLFRKKSTAIIRITVEDRSSWQLYIRDGVPVDADVPVATDTLGRVLFELGTISSEAYNGSLADLAKGGKLHGQILIAAGALDSAGLARGLGQQVLRKFGRAMALERGIIEVVIDEHRRGVRPDTPRVDPRLIIHQGVRRSYSAARLDKDLAVLDGKAVRLVAGVELGAYGLSPDDKGLVDQLAASFHSLEDLRIAAGRQATSAQMIAYCLLVTEALEVRELRDVKPGERADVAAVLTPVAPDKMGDSRRAVGAEADAMRERIRSKAAALSDDLYAMLELPDGATVDEVRRAYFALAKIYHPDRLMAQGLDDLQGDAARVLARVNQAFAMLSDPRRRAEYETRRRAGDTKAKQAAEETETQRILDAEFACEKAEILVKRRDFAAALTEAKRAVELSPREGRYQAVLAWVIWQSTPPSDQPALLPKTRATMDKAVRAEPMFANGHYWLALLARQAGDEAAAMRGFNKTFELDPRNLDAEREIRLHNMRKQKSR